MQCRDHGLAWVIVLTGCVTQADRSAVLADRRAPTAAAAEAPRAALPTGATAATPQPAAGAGMSAADIQAITVQHDRVRADVGVPPLRWLPALATYAQRWADYLAATSCGLQHRTQGAYGENLFQGTLGFYRAADAALAWEGEKKDYRGGAVTPANVHAIGHYTQMVWRDTTSFGCGLAVCRDTLIVACNYDPPGNFIGRAPY